MQLTPITDVFTVYVGLDYEPSEIHYDQKYQMTTVDQHTLMLDVPHNVNNVTLYLAVRQGRYCLYGHLPTQGPLLPTSRAAGPA